MRKRFVSLLLLTIILLNVTYTIVLAYEKEISVVLDGEEIVFDVQPQIINNRTMVPLRAIFEALDATVEWDEDTQTVTSVKGEKEIILSIGVDRIIVNGSNKTLDTSPCIVNGRTLVPIRAISEAFNMDVIWNQQTQTVTILSPIENNSITANSYRKLRNAIAEYGKYNAIKDYTIRYAPKGSDYGYLLTYMPERELSIIYVSDDGVTKLAILIEFFEDKMPELSMRFVRYGMYEHNSYGEFNEDKKFIKEQENVPPALRHEFDNLMKSTLELMDLLLQKSTNGITLEEMGITY